MTEDERKDLHEQAQDLARTATVLDGVYAQLSSSEWDALVEAIGKEVYELVRRRVDQARDEQEAAKEATR